MTVDDLIIELRRHGPDTEVVLFNGDLATGQGYNSVIQTMSVTLVHSRGKELGEYTNVDTLKSTKRTPLKAVVIY